MSNTPDRDPDLALQIEQHVERIADHAFERDHGNALLEGRWQGHAERARLELRNFAEWLLTRERELMRKKVCGETGQ